jgi:hypothetical protein
MASRPGSLIPGTQWIGGWIGPRISLDDVRKRKLALPGLELQPLGLSRFTDCAIPALSTEETEENYETSGSEQLPHRLRTGNLLKSNNRYHRFLGVTSRSLVYFTNVSQQHAVSAFRADDPTLGIDSG